MRDARAGKGNGQGKVERLHEKRNSMQQKEGKFKGTVGKERGISGGKKDASILGKEEIGRER